jgi:hypothetical protein
MFRMIESGRGPRFAQDPRRRVGVIDGVGGQNLDGDGAAEDSIASSG